MDRLSRRRYCCLNLPAWASSMARGDRLLLPLVAGLACGQIDRILEGGPPPLNANLQLSVQPTTLSVVQGTDHVLAVSVRRVGDYFGPVTVTVHGLPPGITAELGDLATEGQVTTGTVTLLVGDSTAAQTYVIVIRGHADPLRPAAASLGITVLPRPDYRLISAPPALTIARGGIGPLRVTLERSHFTLPVTVSLEGAGGILAAFEPNPVPDTSTTAIISVASGVVPGTYDMTLRGTATGLADREASFSLTVTADALQVIVQPELHAAQGSTAAMEVIVNRAGFTGPVTLAAENLPPGVTASFQGGDAGSPTTMVVTVGPAAAAGSSLVRVRAQGAGVPGATAEFFLHVQAAGISLSLTPASLSVVPGAAATAAVTIGRTSFTGPVALRIDGLPAGVTGSLTPAITTGDAATLTITSAAAAVPGQYIATLRAVPEGLAPEAAQTLVLGLTVRQPVPGGGNVVLDWSRCAAPGWVAAQDGNGPWIRLESASAVFEFPLHSDRGAFAWVQATSASVRYLTREDLVGDPLDMCGPAPGTKTILGTAEHVGPTETWQYSLGGGRGSSIGTNPDFTIAGVRDGVHDLVGFGLSFRLPTYRVLLRREVDLDDGGSLGVVSLHDPDESFPRAQAGLQFLGPVEPGGRLTMSMSYLTTAACTVNHLHDFSILWGVPEVAQRPDDYHMLVAWWTTSTGVVRVTDVFHRLANRIIALPPPVSAVVETRPGSYKMLGATLASLPAVYNRSVTLAYNSGTRSMSVTASAAFLNGVPSLRMPDLSGVDGWPEGVPIPADAAGSWTVTLEGDNGRGSLCVEGRRRVQGIRRGSF